MPKIKFIDLNPEIVDLVARECGLESKCADIIEYQDNFGGVLVTASNPKFTMGGGLDAKIKAKFPWACELARQTKGNKRIDDIIFTVTVNDKLKATPKLVESALYFAIKMTQRKETLLLSGLGCGIGGMEPEEFVQILKKCLKQ